MIAGLMVGCIYALADALMLRFVMKKAQRTPEKSSKIVMLGLGSRYLLTIAVLGFAFLIPAIDVLWVVLPLIAQKVFVVLLAMLPSKQK